MGCQKESVVEEWGIGVNAVRTCRVWLYMGVLSLVWMGKRNNKSTQMVVILRIGTSRRCVCGGRSCGKHTFPFVYVVCMTAPSNEHRRQLYQRQQQSVGVFIWNDWVVCLPFEKKKKSHNHLESRDGLDYVFCFLMKQFLAWGSCHVEIIHKAHNISLIIVLQQDNLKMD